MVQTTVGRVREGTASVTAEVWISGEQQTVNGLLDRRLADDPDGEYLDVCGTKLSAAEVASAANRLANALAAWASARATGWPRSSRTRPRRCSPGGASSGAARWPCRSTPPTRASTCATSSPTRASRVLIVEAVAGRPRGRASSQDTPALEHVVVIGGAGRAARRDGPHVGRRCWAATTPSPAVDVRPADLATFIYTGGTTGPSKGCMLSHNYHEVLARQIGICWRRTADDVVWTPLPLFHFNAIVTAVLGPARLRRAGGDLPAVLGVELLARDEPHRRHRHLDARHDGLPARPRRRPARDAAVGRARGQHVAAADRGGAAAGRGRLDPARALRHRDVQRRLRHRPRPAWSRGSRRACATSPTRAGVINDEYFDVRIFDDDDNELPRGTDGEIVLRPKRPHTMFEGYWGRPEATVETSRNWWYHTGDIGRVDDEGFLFFVDRKADYLRRRGENISSFEVERVLMGHGVARRRGGARRAQRGDRGRPEDHGHAGRGGHR